MERIWFCAKCKKPKFLKKEIDKAFPLWYHVDSQARHDNDKQKKIKNFEKSA